MDEFVTVTEAARLAGVSRATISRRLAAGEVPVYVGSDRRQRLLRRADVARLSRVERQTTSERGAQR